MRTQRGMTLLELLLAVTLLAAVFALAAGLWSQASSWGADAGRSSRALRLARVLELMRAQWAERRTSVRLGGAGQTLLVDSERLEFVSGVSVLEAGWPLSIVELRIERDYEGASDGVLRSRLVLRETPIVDVGDGSSLKEEAGGGSVRRGAADGRPAEAPPIREIVLLKGCLGLAFERYGRSDASLRAERVRRARAESEADSQNEEVVAASEPRAELQEGEDWHALKGYEGPVPRAVRLVGEFEGEHFACVFMIGDSR